MYAYADYTKPFVLHTDASTTGLGAVLYQKQEDGKERVITYVSLCLHVQNAVPTQPCVGKLGISLVLRNFLLCNFRLWFKTP